MILISVVFTKLVLSHVFSLDYDKNGFRNYGIHGSMIKNWMALDKTVSDP